MLSCVPSSCHARSASLTAQVTKQVIGTVSRITRQAATLSLLTVDGRPCRPDFTGIIRSQDVRQTAKDSVKVRIGLERCGLHREADVCSVLTRRSGLASDLETSCAPKSWVPLVYRRLCSWADFLPRRFRSVTLALVRSSLLTSKTASVTLLSLQTSSRPPPTRSECSLLFRPQQAKHLKPSAGRRCGILRLARSSRGRLRVPSRFLVERVRLSCCNHMLVPLLARRASTIGRGHPLRLPHLLRLLHPPAVAATLDPARSSLPNTTYARQTWTSITTWYARAVAGPQSRFISPTDHTHPDSQIILGTGLTECVLSGLLSVEGKKVLHMDRCVRRRLGHLPLTRVRHRVESAARAIVAR